MLGLVFRLRKNTSVWKQIEIVGSVLSLTSFKFDFIVLTTSPLTLTFPFVLTTYLFISHTLPAPVIAGTVRVKAL
jgi:hypothetical protein